MLLSFRGQSRSAHCALALCKIIFEFMSFFFCSVFHYVFVLCVSGERHVEGRRGGGGGDVVLFLLENNTLGPARFYFSVKKQMRMNFCYCVLAESVTDSSTTGN